MKNFNLRSTKPIWHSFFLVFLATLFSGIPDYSQAQIYDSCVKADFRFATDQTLAKFGAVGKGPIVLYKWDFGDGNSASGQYARHRYTKPGSYKVCLTAYGFDTTTQKRCRYQVCKKVVIRCLLKADWDYKQVKNAFKFKAKSNSRNAVYYWTFGDSNGERGRTVGHKYDKPGQYKVCLYVKDTVTGCKLEICKRVVIPTDCKLEGNFKFRQDDNLFKFVAKSNSRSSQYFWTFGDGSRGKGQALKHRYKKPGIYDVCLIIKDSIIDCKIRICKKVEVKRCDLKGDFAYRQTGHKFKFSARSNSKSAKYIWTFGDGSRTTGHNVLHRYTKPGVYKVCLIVQDKRDICRIEICKRVVIKDTCNLKADFTYRQDGNKFKFKARANANTVVFGWTFGDGTAVRENLTEHQYAKAGIYEVCLYAVDTATDCRIKICKKVRVKDTCDLKADFKFRIDSNGIAYFYARSNDTNASYGWLLGDSSFARGQQVRHKYSTGKYKVCLIVYKDSSCKIRVCKRIIIRRNSASGSFSVLDADDIQNAHTGNPSKAIEQRDWDVLISPNPVKYDAKVIVDREDIQLVSVYTLEGVKVKELQAGNLTESNFADLPTGSYFIKVFASDGSMQSVRFFKN